MPDLEQDLDPDPLRAPSLAPVAPSLNQYPPLPVIPSTLMLSTQENKILGPPGFIVGWHQNWVFGQFDQDFDHIIEHHGTKDQRLGMTEGLEVDFPD